MEMVFLEDEIFRILTNNGCKDVDLTKQRFCNDVTFYLQITKRMFEEKSFSELGEAIKRNDYVNSFKSGHLLKGIIANCGITPMFEIICGIVEMFRNRENPLNKNEKEKVNRLYKELLTARKKFKGIFNKEI